jgi:RNA polymerase sigma factor (sigma-70 family)
MKRKLNVLLADDHPMVRTGLRLMLEQQKIYDPVITEVENGQQAVEAALEGNFDIILLDINLPILDGVSVIRQCKQKEVLTPILAITMHNEEHIVKQVVEAGAMGYLIKNCGIEELMKAIKTVLNRKQYFCNEATQSLLSKTSRKRVEDQQDQLLVKRLTEREKRVIQLVAAEMTNSEIAEELGISKRTVEGHRSKIISKLEVKNTAGMIRFALENGLVD